MTIKVLILTSRGPRHSYFCRRLAEHFEIKGIVVDDRYHFPDRFWGFLKNNQFNPVRMIQSLRLKKNLEPYEEKENQIEQHFFSQDTHLPEFPSGVPLHYSPDPNSSETIRWIQNFSPDVIVVFGTRLIRDPILSLAKLGALNLHTGLSPYYRGGQCTFWCLYHGDLEHVGVTVHYLNQRIDGGDIVFTAQPEMEAGDTVRSIECKLVLLGTEGMIQSIRDLTKGTAKRIPQTEKGKLFLSKMFSLEKRLELQHRLKKGLMRELVERSASVKTHS